MKVIKKRFKNTSIPVETVTKIMKIIREIPREELSPKILEFCGNSTAYEVEEKLMPQKKGEIVFRVLLDIHFSILMCAIIVLEKR